MSKLIERVLGVDYHRNGVCGNSFYVVDFIFISKEDGKRQRLQAVYLMPSDKDGDYAKEADIANCFVTDPLDITNRWRGDHFAEEIHKICVEYSERRWDDLMKKTEGKNPVEVVKVRVRRPPRWR